MKMFSSLLGLIAPDTCVGCGIEGATLCGDCAGQLYWPDQCYKCRAMSKGGITCAKCTPKTKLVAVFFAAAYVGSGKLAVGRAKYRPSSSAAAQLGKILASKLPYLTSDTVVVHIPTTPSRILERGFDQSAVIAQSVAKAKKLMHVSALHRLTKSHQVGSDRDSRILHMKNAFEVKNQSAVHGKTVVLVDDVVTTGATLESAAAVVYAAGASRIIGAIFSRAP